MNMLPNMQSTIAFTANHKMPDRVYPTFYINNAPVERVKSWPHLGNILHEDQDEAVNINHRCSKMIGDINDVLCTFGKLDCVVKVDLLYKYCNSYYSSVLWKLNHPAIMRISSAWRNALRRVWNLPCNTNTNLITALSCRLSLTDELCRRVIKFHAKCMNSSNEVIKHVCLNAISESRALSKHGCNLLHICDTYGFCFSLFEQCDVYCNILSNFTEVCKKRMVAVDESKLESLHKLIMLT